MEFAVEYGTADVLAAVERASRRTANIAREELRNGLNSVAIVSSVAAMTGTLGMTIQFLKEGFTGPFGNATTGLIMISGRVASSAFLILLGLLVSIIAFVIYRYLSDQIEDFDREMTDASVDLVNRLVADLERLGKPLNSLRWVPKQGEPGYVVRRVVDPPLGAPSLSIGKRMHRYGVLEMVWPRLRSELDGAPVLHGAMCVLFAYGAMVWICSSIGWPTIGVLEMLFLTLCGLAVRTGSRFASVLVLGFFAVADVECVRLGLWASLVFVAIAPLLLIGSVKVGWTARTESVTPWLRWLVNAFLAAAMLAVLVSWFGPTPAS